MAKRSVEDGDNFVFKGLESEDGALRPLGSDTGALVPGTEVTVRETVKADEQGAHDNNEDAIVVEWQSPTLVQGENGVEVGYITRAVSIGVDAFHDQFEVK